MWGNLFASSGVPSRYKLSKSPHASGGNDYIWRVYEAADSKEQNNPVSVFICDKNEISKRISDPTIRKPFLDKISLSVKTMASLKHPQILNVKDIVPETKNSIIFVTEPVKMSLGNAFKEFMGLVDEEISTEMRQFRLDHFGTSCGLFHVACALQFLHKNGITHGNLCPENIFITQSGHWKLCGFIFAIKGELCHPSAFAGLDPRQLAPLGTPSLFYASPESLMGQMSGSSDCYSFGALMFEVHLGRKVIDGGGSAVRFHRKLDEWHQAAMCSLQVNSNVISSRLPNGSNEIVRSLLQSNPQDRSSIAAVLNNEYWFQGPVGVMRVLDGVIEMINYNEKTAALEGFKSRLEECQNVSLLKLILPQVLILFRDPRLSPLLLESVVFIASELPKDILQREVLPDIIRSLNPKTMSQQMLMQAVLNMEALVLLGDSDFASSFIVPILAVSMECPVSQICIGALKQLPSTGAVLVTKCPSVIEATVLPRLHRLLTSNQNQSIRINGLIALAGLVEKSLVTKNLIADLVVPMIRGAVKADRSAATIMCVLGILKSLARMASFTQLSCCILPMTVALCNEQCLNQVQFKMVVDTSMMMMDLIVSLKKFPKKYSSEDTKVTFHNPNVNQHQNMIQNSNMLQNSTMNQHQNINQHQNTIQNPDTIQNSNTIQNPLQPLVATKQASSDPFASLENLNSGFTFL